MMWIFEVEKPRIKVEPVDEDFPVVSATASKPLKIEDSPPQAEIQVGFLHIRNVIFTILWMLF